MQMTIRHMLLLITAWKVSKYGVFSGPNFSASGLNTYSVQMRKNTDQKKTLFLATFHVVNDIYSLIFSLDEASKSSFTWFDSNLMKNNADKCQLLVRSNEKVTTHSFPMHSFSTPWKHQKTLRCFQGVEKGCIGNKCVEIGSHDITNTKRGKLLGIHLDRELSFDYHYIKNFQKKKKQVKKFVC